MKMAEHHMDIPEGEPKNSTGQSINEIVLSEEDDNLIKELFTLENSTDGASESQRSTNKKITKIQKIPDPIIQKDYEKHYKPQQIAIGPLHAESENLQKKELKVKFAAQFTQNKKEKGELFLKEIKKNIDELRDFFDKKCFAKDYDDETLARMLFLDGCSVLQFIDSYICENLIWFNINNSQAALIEQDLFLLENQIPFQVLLLLMKCRKDKYYLLESISIFITRNNMAPMNKYSRRQEAMIRMHLIDFCDNNPFRKEPVHLLDLLRSAILFDLFRRDTNDSHSYSPQRPFRWSFRNVQDLKAAGIKFVPSYIRGLKSVSFRSRFIISGQLKVPPLIVDDTTERKLLNLVAYEMCFNDDTPKKVTSYINFLDSLIDSVEDVKDLRSMHILQNYLNSDAAVADLFNRIGRNFMVHDTYSELKEEIQKHYERKFAVWIAEVYKDHFRSPWKILALLATVTVLSLTAIQSYYAMHPNK